MPASNGFDVLRKIRAQPSMRKLQVIMLTAHETPEYVVSRYTRNMLPKGCVLAPMVIFSSRFARRS